MAGILKVDRVQSDSNLAFQVGTANVAYINSTGLNITGGQIIGNGNIYREANGLLYANNGISFPATQVSSSDANTLDDYEEGTWIPTFGGFNGDFSAITYNGRVASYTKIGRVVHVQGQFAWSGVSGGSGVACIKNLPFAPATTNGSSTPCFAEFAGITFGTGATQLSGEIFGSLIYFIATGSGLSSSPSVGVTSISASGYIYFSATYIAAT